MKALGVLVAIFATTFLVSIETEAKASGIIYKCENPTGVEFYIARSHGSSCQAFLRFKSGQWYRSNRKIWVYSGGAYQETSHDCEMLTNTDLRIHMSASKAQVRNAKRRQLDVRLHWGRARGEVRGVQIALHGDTRETAPRILKCRQFQPLEYDPMESPKLTFND